MGDYLPVPVIISENSFIAMSVLAGQVEKLMYLRSATFQNLRLTYGAEIRYKSKRLSLKFFLAASFAELKYTSLHGLP
jgi:hypothetical protein